jgi:hypothetical protein
MQLEWKTNLLPWPAKIMCDLASVPTYPASLYPADSLTALALLVSFWFLEPASPFPTCLFRRHFPQPLLLVAYSCLSALTLNIFP